MAIASITAWLNSNRDFHHGKMLYEQYGSDPLILAIIRTGTGNYHFSKLLQGMEELNKLSNLQPKQITFKDPPPLDDQTDKWKYAPDPILKIRNEKNYRYAQARKRFETIPLMDSQDHRLAAALDLLDDMDFVNESWGAIDQWRENGTIREMRKIEQVQEVSELSLKELLKQSKNIATYISKDKTALRNTDSPKGQIKLKARLEIRESKLQEINRRINELV